MSLATVQPDEVEPKSSPFTLSVGRSPESKGQRTPDVLIGAAESACPPRPQANSDPSTPDLRSYAQGERGCNAELGGLLALGAVAMFFGALLFAYAFLRAAAPSWPPAGLPLLPRLLPTAGAILLAAASVWLERAPGLRLRAAGALGLGLFFCVVQGALWRILLAAGFGAAGTGAYGAIFWALTVAHVAHVAVGLVGLGLCLRAPSPLRLSLWTRYWHLLFAIWAAIVVLVFWI